jgi:beta-lactamase regulating signal transducer with metallopeptidase domain
MTSLLHVCPSYSVMFAASLVLLHVTLITGIALLVMAVLGRRRPSARHAVGLSALFALLIIPIIACATRCAGITLFELSIGSVDVSTESAPLPSIPAIVDTPSVGGQAATIPSVTTADAIRGMFAVCVAVYLTGVVCLILRLVHGVGFLATVCSTTENLDERRYGQTLQDVRDRLTCRNLPPILVSKTIPMPVAVGVLSPKVLVPVGFGENLQPDQFSDVLTHECAHVLRRDLWVGLLQRVIEIFLWPHPLVHVLNRWLAESREELCDNHVLAGRIPAEYAQCLLDISRTIIDQEPILATASLVGPGWKTQDRVKGLLDEKRSWSTSSRGGVIAGFSAIFSVIAISVFGVSQAAPDGQDRIENTLESHVGSKSAPYKRISLQERIDQLTIPKIEFMATPIVEAVEFLRKASVEHDDPALPARERGVNILLDVPDADALPVITFSARNITLKEAVNLVTELSGLNYKVEENVVRIASAARNSK